MIQSRKDIFLSPLFLRVLKDFLTNCNFNDIRVIDDSNDYEKVIKKQSNDQIRNLQPFVYKEEKVIGSFYNSQISSIVKGVRCNHPINSSTH